MNVEHQFLSLLSLINFMPTSLHPLPPHTHTHTHTHTLAFPYSTEKEIDEGLRLGDYPVLPWRSAQQERPTGWWDNQDRRDKETPVNCAAFFLLML